MFISREHNTTKETAKKKINSFLDSLMKQEFPKKVKVKNAKKSWDEDTMFFSFIIKKGIVWKTISGEINIKEKTVELSSSVSGIIKTFVSEDKIVKVINKQFDELFS